MTRKNKKYDKEFKLEAAKLVTQHGYSYAEAARQLGLEDWAIRVCLAVVVLRNATN